MGRLGSSSLEGYLRVMDRLYNATTMLSNALAHQYDLSHDIDYHQDLHPDQLNNLYNDHQMTSTMTDTMTMIMIRRICNM